MEKDIKSIITDIKLSIRHLTTLGVPTKQLIDATKAIEEELAESEDERIRKHLIGVVELYYGNTDEQEKKDCLAWLEKRGEQKPVENQDYSELTELERAIHRGCITKETAKDCLSQINVGWSEEEDMINSIIRELIHQYNEEIPQSTEVKIKWLKNKLKSLRPQNKWKPSEKQLYILNWVANILLSGKGIVEIDASKTLDSLYNDLKKLSEEDV